MMAENAEETKTHQGNNQANTVSNVFQKKFCEILAFTSFIFLVFRALKLWMRVILFRNGLSLETHLQPPFPAHP